MAQVNGDRAVTYSAGSKFTCVPNFTYTLRTQAYTNSKMHAFLMLVKYCTYIYCKGTLDTCIETISDPFSSCSHPSFLSIPLEIEKGFLRPRLLFICLNAMDMCNCGCSVHLSL